MTLLEWSGILAIEGRPTDLDRVRVLVPGATKWETPLPLMVPYSLTRIRSDFIVGGTVTMIRREGNQLRGEGQVYSELLTHAALTYGAGSATAAVGIDLVTPWDGIEYDEDKRLFMMQGSIRTVSLNEAPAWPECLIEIRL